MSVETFRVVRLVQKQVRVLDDARTSDKLPVDYETPKDGMLNLHGEWQDLMSAVRNHEVPGLAALAAIRLAAAAIKFATDLGDPVQMGLEANEDNGPRPQEALRFCESEDVPPRPNRRKRSKRPAALDAAID